MRRPISNDRNESKTVICDQVLWSALSEVWFRVPYLLPSTRHATGCPDLRRRTETLTVFMIGSSEASQ
jgi:hypothetical protein